MIAAMRDDALLRAMVGEAVAVADGVNLRPWRIARLRSLVHWSGWMAAAILGLVWLATDPRMQRAPEGARRGEIVRSEAPDAPRVAPSTV